MKKILPTQTYGNPADLAKAIKGERNVKLANRLNAIRLLQLEYPYKEVSKICGVCRTSLQKWVSKWNAAGKEGLASKSGGNRKSRVTDRMRADIREVVEIKREINGKAVTAIMICGRLKKTSQ